LRANSATLCALRQKRTGVLASMSTLRGCKKPGQTVSRAPVDGVTDDTHLVAAKLLQEGLHGAGCVGHDGHNGGFVRGRGCISTQNLSMSILFYSIVELSSLEVRIVYSNALFHSMSRKVLLKKIGNKFTRQNPVKSRQHGQRRRRHA